MPRGPSLLLLSSFLAFATLAKDDGKDADLRAIREFVSSKYLLDLQPRPAGRINIYYANAAIASIPHPGLRDFLPDTRFYRTSLRTNTFCYPSVNLLAAITGHGKNVRVASCLSPTFTAPDRDFLAQFKGLQARTDTQKLRLVASIGQLFSMITYNGFSVAEKVKESSAQVQLWHNDRRFRTISLSCDDAGFVEQVEVGR